MYPDDDGGSYTSPAEASPEQAPEMEGAASTSVAPTPNVPIEEPQEIIEEASAPAKTVEPFPFAIDKFIDDLRGYLSIHGYELSRDPVITGRILNLGEALRRK